MLGAYCDAQIPHKQETSPVSALMAPKKTTTPIALILARETTTVRRAGQNPLPEACESRLHSSFLPANVTPVPIWWVSG